MEEKRYPILDEEESTGHVSEPAVGYAATSNVAEMKTEFKYPKGYDGFYSEDPEEFEKYKSELIAEAMNDGSGFSWKEVKQQIIDRHPWLR